MEFLKPENTNKAQKWFEELEDKGFCGQPYIRFWSETEVQIDGDMTLNELKSLVELMEGFI